MLADDRIDYPMQFFFRLVFQGPLDRELFADSLKSALARHPLLMCTVAERFGRTHAWLESDQFFLRESDQGFETLSDVLEWPGIDLTNEPGLRTWLYRAEDRAELLFQIHHTCCDGIGALEFIRDIFSIYHGQGDEAVPIEAARLDQLHSRSKIPLTLYQVIRKIPRDLYDFFRIASRRPVELSTKEPDLTRSVAPGHRRSEYLSHQLTTDELDNLLKKSRKHHATLTHIVMRDLFRTIDDWLNQHTDDRRRWIRICVPTNVRNQTQTAGPCSNQVTIMFIDQHSSRLGQPDNLLRRIARDTAYHRRSLITFSMLQFLKVLALAPPVLRRFVRRNKQMSSSVLSNVGRVFEDPSLPKKSGKVCLGEMTLDSIEFLVPLRSGTEAAFGMSTYAGRLTLCLHYKPHKIRSAAAQELFDLLISNLKESAATSSE